MRKKYENYTVDQFLEDPFFIEWVKCDSPEANRFWQQWMATNSDNVQVMKEAKLQLSGILSAQRIDTEQGASDEVWERITESLHLNEEQRGSSFTWWAAAAAVILIVVGSLWFFQDAVKQATPAVAEATPVDIEPGSNKAVLTLADGSKIELDSMNSGRVIDENGVQVIQLDGELSYEAGNDAREVQYHTISTPLGGQFTVVLADGSKVWLNAGSSLRYPTAFKGKYRKVSIEGEGYFEVAHNKKMPFRVETGGMKVEVLGTHFNVEAYAGEAARKVTLLSGSVQVVNDRTTKLIIPGEQVRLDNKSGQMSVIKDVDIDEVIAWKNGFFYFNGADLKKVLNEIGRWYDVNVVFEGAVPKRSFGGEIQRNLNLSQVLKLLEKNQVRFKLEGNKLIVKQ